VLLVQLSCAAAAAAAQVSISTLFAFWIVALALMWKRYYTPGSTGKNAMMAGQLLLMVGAALSE
jgi:hypothetical protein